MIRLSNPLKQQSNFQLNIFVLLLIESYKMQRGYFDIILHEIEYSSEKSHLELFQKSHI